MIALALRSFAVLPETPAARCLARHGTAGRRACEIRLRAERKSGELLQQQEKAKGSAQPGIGRAGGTRSDGPTTLRDLGISKQQSSD
jgi:hypothetical protein